MTEGRTERRALCRLLSEPELKVGVKDIEELLDQWDIGVLLAATDVHGRRAVDSALPQIKSLIDGRLLFLRRYRLGAPVHQSATCRVIQAEDVGDGGRLVVLKFMREHDQFEREKQARAQFELPEDIVVGVLRHHTLIDAKTGLEYFREGYVYCLVMPCGDANLQDALTHEHLAPSPTEVHWDAVREIVESVATCLLKLHKLGVMHGDVKPLNLMRFLEGPKKQAVWKLIDLDAAAVIPVVDQGHEGTDSPLSTKAGAKSSTAYVAPEILHRSADGAVVVKTGVAQVDREGTSQPLGYECLPASAAFDAWSLGMVLFLMSTGKTLFNMNLEDNLTSDDLLKLIQWSVASTKAKAEEIQHRLAKNLVCRLLEPDPAKRISMEEVLKHPFVTGKAPAGRLDGEEPQYDAFISYRVATDKDMAIKLHSDLTCRGFRVYLDKCCLEPGKDWEEGFCEGLVQSLVFIAIVSKKGLFSGETRGDLSQLKTDSPCDNVVLEHQLALELKGRGLIKGIITVQMDPEISPKTAAVCVVDSIDVKLEGHLKRLGLGKAGQKRTVQQTLEEIFACSDGSTEAGGATGALESIEACLQTLQCEPRFDVCVSYRGGIDDDQRQATELCSTLHSRGIRAKAIAASTGATGVLQLKPLIFVPIESSASLAPLSRPDAASSADPLAVEWAVALALQEAKEVDYLFPVFLGTLDWDGKRHAPRLWSEGSEHVVPEVNQLVSRLVPGTEGASWSSRELLGKLNRNQGQFVGGGPQATLEAAARQIAQMGGTISQEQDAARHVQELKADIGRRAHMAEALQAEKDELIKAALAEKEQLRAALAEKEQLRAEKDEQLRAALAEKEQLRAEKEQLRAALAEAKKQRN